MKVIVFIKMIDLRMLSFCNSFVKFQLMLLFLVAEMTAVLCFQYDHSLFIHFQYTVYSQSQTARLVFDGKVFIIGGSRRVGG